MPERAGVRGRKKPARVPPEFRAKVLKVLGDPKVHDLVLKHGPTVIDWAKERGRGGSDRITDLGGKFGQKGLELRATRVREAVLELSQESRTLADSFLPVLEALDEVDKLLKVAGALPLVKRKKAHRKIDSRLDVVEAGLSELVLQSSPSS